MKIAEYSYYIDEYYGEYLDEDIFTALYKRAVFILKTAVMKDIENTKDYSTKVKGLLKDGICAQIEYLYLNGGAEFLAESNGVKEVSLGRFALKNNEKGGSLISPIAINYLKIAGLLNRRVGICL